MPPSRKTITHLITSLGGGGTENFLVQILSDSAPQYAHRVYFLGKDGVNGDRLRNLGIPVQRISPFGFYALMKRNPPDVLHTCLFWGNQVGRVIGKLAHVPCILSTHQSIDIWQKPWHRWLDKRTLPLASIIDANSDAALELLKERLKGARTTPRLAKVENGVDFGVFKAQDRASARRALGLPTEGIVGGTLMRLHPEKGAERIPAFARELLRAHPNLVLAIGGLGPLGERLKEETKDLGERIRWLGWQDNVVQFLSSIDFFWLLSREESFPQALLEASAVGLPWVARDVGGVHELLAAGASGLMTPSKDPVAIAQLGAQLLRDLAENTQKAKAAIPALQARYSLQTMRQAFYRLVL